jgi:hypothetical protein
MQKPPAPIEVFYSCSDSPDDAPLREQLERHLSILQREGLIATWHQRQIIAGSVRQEEVDRHLNTASLILLLISADFLASDYCYGVEMQRALQRHTAREAQVIPILLRACIWQSAPFARLEMLPSGNRPITMWPNRDEAWTDVAMRIRQIFGGKSAATAPHAPGTPAQGRTPIETITTLFLAANPASTTRLALDEEMRAIEQKVWASEHRKALVFQSSWAVRPDDLLQLLNQHRPQIVHFSGHGDQTGLWLTGNEGEIKLVTTHALQVLFATLKDHIRLVFFNACFSREQAQALTTTIDCVVGMKQRVCDKAATIFASSFYRAIGFGRSIREAFDQGRAALLLEGVSAENTPELLVKDGIDPERIVLIRP